MRLTFRLRIGGGSRIRTGDILLAKQTLYQLSYIPIVRMGVTPRSYTGTLPDGQYL